MLINTTTKQIHTAGTWFQILKSLKRDIKVSEIYRTKLLHNLHSNYTHTQNLGLILFRHILHNVQQTLMSQNRLWIKLIYGLHENLPYKKFHGECDLNQRCHFGSLLTDIEPPRSMYLDSTLRIISEQKGNSYS